MSPIRTNATMTVLTHVPSIAVAGYFSMHCYLALQLNHYARELKKERDACRVFNEHGHICSGRVTELRETQSRGETPYIDSGTHLCKKTIKQRNILANMEPFIDIALFPDFWRRQIKEIEEVNK